jgi:hypothetical protein
MLKPVISKSMFLILIILSAVVFGMTGTAVAEVPLFKGQTIYVPVYSHIYSGNREQPFYLAATLSIRNTDRAHAIVLTAVEYYDSEGTLLKHYLDKAFALNPMATKRYVVPESDKSGGSGAKFIVQWQSDQAVVEPLIEAVMISTKTQQGISFTSRGRVLEATSP